MLTAQGPDAPGGAFGYVVNGKMIGGFALVPGRPSMACPELGRSSLITMVLVYEKDLGPATAAQALRMTQFNPDKSWRPVVLE